MLFVTAIDMRNLFGKVVFIEVCIVIPLVHLSNKGKIAGLKL